MIKQCFQGRSVEKPMLAGADFRHAPIRARDPGASDQLPGPEG